MNVIGTLIESRRKRLGLSRLQLANRLGVSNQTVLNIERDDTYNLGTSVMRRLEEALNVDFEINMKEEAMTGKITMGNDEFILYIRKNFKNCKTTNEDLGRSIWKGLKALDEGAAQTGKPGGDACLWGETAANLNDTLLPKTATQFQFERSCLPAVYELLDELGSV